MSFSARMAEMLAWMQSDACPQLDTPEFRAVLARPIADTPSAPPREDYAVEPSGRVAALRARADMLIRNAVDDLKEAEQMERAGDYEEAEHG